MCTVGFLHYCSHRDCYQHHHGLKKPQVGARMKMIELQSIVSVCLLQSLFTAVEIKISCLDSQDRLCPPCPLCLTQGHWLWAVSRHTLCFKPLCLSSCHGLPSDPLTYVCLEILIASPTVSSSKPFLLLLPVS